MSVHEPFDLDYWTRELSLSSLAAEVRRWAGTQTGPLDEPEYSEVEDGLPHGGINGPEDLAVIERIRAGFGVDTLGPSVPTDVFVWALGEPSNPAATKMGGVPYRLASQPWPEAYNGKQMQFLAQVCFADSRDVVLTPGRGGGGPSSLPGDVLLIYAPGDYLVDWDEDEQESLAFEWYPLGLSDLAASAIVPQSPLTPIHAQILRTADYREPPQGHPIYNLYSGRDIGMFSGTKIGGVPKWQQGDPGLPGVHLCTMASVNPYGERYPLLNLPTNPKGNVDGNFLMMGDLGSLYLFIDTYGRIHWTVQGG